MIALTPVNSVDSVEDGDGDVVGLGVPPGSGVGGVVGFGGGGVGGGAGGGGGVGGGVGLMTVVRLMVIVAVAVFPAPSWADTVMTFDPTASATTKDQATVPEAVPPAPVV